MNKYVYGLDKRSKSGNMTHQLELSGISKNLSWHRPFSASISDLSLIENNRRLIKNIEKTQDPMIKSLEFLKKSKLAGFILPDNEISKMLVHLDRITRNTMYGQKKIELTESEKINIELLPGEAQFVLINTKGQISPLNIMIHRNYGALEIYMSTKIKEPTKILNEEVYNKDYIKISDKSFFFVTGFVALNFTAVKETNFSVSIKFGQKVVMKKKMNASVPMLKVNKDTENLEKTEKIGKKKIVKKNYIKLNQTLESFVKPVDRSELEKKRLIVRERHRNIQQQVLEKRKVFIKKHEIRLDAELKGKEILDVIRRKQNFEKFWLTLFKLGDSLLQIRTTIKTQRVVKLKFYKSLFAARKIQRNLKKKFENYSVEERAVDNCNLLFKLYRTMTQFCLGFLNVKIVKCIKQSYTQKNILSTFTIFFKKLILIQEMFREYQIVNQIRVQEIEDKWTDALNYKLEAIHWHKKKTKKWKKKMTKKYNNISPEIKAKAIGDYFTGIKVNYLRRVKEYHQRTKKRNFGRQKSKLSENDVEGFSLLYPPIFKYLPSTKEMIELIDSILGIEVNDDA